MRTGEENIVVPRDSPERPPATNYAAVRSSSPACLSITRAPLSAAAAEAGASLGCAVSGPRQRLRVLCGPPCPSGRPNSSSLGFLKLFCFILFTDLCIDSKICIS